MLVTSLAGICAASLISPFEYDENAKDKSYVKLVVEAPASRVLRPGQVVSISAQILKARIVEGKLEDTVSVVGGAEIKCTSGQEIIVMDPAKASDSSLSFSVIDDLDALIKFTKTISFSVTGYCDGKTLKADVMFTVPAFSVSPVSGTFVVGKGTEEVIKLQSNFKSDYRYEFSDERMLDSLPLNTEDYCEEIKLIEDFEDADKRFDMFTCKIVKDYKLEAPIDGFAMKSNYRAVFLRECILLPRSTKIPIVIKCYKDEQSDKRTQEAYLFIAKVLKYDPKTKNLATDIELTNNLSFSFEPVLDSNNIRFTLDKAEKAVNDAKITAELSPKDGLATSQRPYAIYRIYAGAFCEAETDKINLKMKVFCNDSEIEEIEVKAQLRPKINLKGLITQFIEYPAGTYVATVMSLGNVDAYIEALDKLDDIKIVGTGNPKYDVNTNIMSLRDIPESIEEFAEIQTIHHELCHKIEQIKGDNFYRGGSWGERHSYFIQYLTDAAKILADIERGKVSDIKGSLGEAIYKLYMVCNNADNIEYPPNQGEINDWFGVRSLTPHQIFDKYLNFSVYCRNSSLDEAVIKQVEKNAGSEYFPGDIKGYWKFNGGLFDQGEWIILWQYGNLQKINVKCTGYTLKELSRKWLGGNRLAFEVRYEVVRLSDNDEDELIAIFDAGTFDPGSWEYPKVDKFSVKWKAGRTLSDCILGAHMDKVVELVRK
jgi:hypothetical protein